MVSVTARAEVKDPLASLIPSSASSSRSSNSFAHQLATTLKGYVNQATSESKVDGKVNEVSGRNSGGSQFLAAAKAESASSESTASTDPLGAKTSTARPVTGANPPASTSTTATPSSNIPTMLGMGPVAGTAPVQQVTDPQPVAAAPVSEADAYWAEQPAPVQALRDMPDGEAKDQLALKLANQGYSIDTQIMVWGWDPQMTMTVRANQGYSWVPSYGQANIPVGPGLSMPDNPNSYNPGNPPAGAIQVSTAFAVGTIQNPLVQTDSSST